MYATTNDLELNTDYTSVTEAAAIEEMPQVIHDSELNKIVNELNVICANQKELFENQKLLLENQKRIMKHNDKITMAVAEMSVKLDTIITNPLSYQPQTTSVANYNETMKKSLSNQSFCLKPIKNKTELNYLEEVLEDSEKRAEMKLKYSIVCGTGKAINCAYQLCDVFFDRDFLTQCSWSGSSRGEGTKIGLKTYKNILNLFFELVYDCDKNFTIDENNKFFKAVLKNSTKRKLSKLQRASTCRNTQKRQKLAVVEEVVSNEPNEMRESGVINGPLVNLVTVENIIDNIESSLNTKDVNN